MKRTEENLQVRAGVVGVQSQTNTATGSGGPGTGWPWLSSWPQTEVNHHRLVFRLFASSVPFSFKMWRISEIDMSFGPRIWCREHWGLERRGLGAGNRKRWTVRASWLSGEFNVEQNGYPRLFAWPVPSLAGLPHSKPNALSWRKCDTTSSRSTYSNQRPFPTLVVFPPFKHSKYSSFLNHNLSWKPRHLYSSNGSLQGRSFHK